MKNLKCIIIIIIFTSIINIIIGGYFYKNISTSNIASKNMLEISLLQSLDKNDTKTVKTTLANRIIYDIYYFGKGDFDKRHFTSLCISFNKKTYQLLLDNNEKNLILKSKEFKDGIKNIYALCSLGTEELPESIESIGVYHSLSKR